MTDTAALIEDQRERGISSLERVGVTLLVLYCLVCSCPQEGGRRPGVQQHLGESQPCTLIKKRKRKLSTVRVAVCAYAHSGAREGRGTGTPLKRGQRRRCSPCGEERSVTPLLGFRSGWGVRRLLSPCRLKYLNIPVPRSLAFLPPGSLLKGFCCLSHWLLMVHSPCPLTLTWAPGLSFCDSCPPATAEAISPQERVKRWKDASLKLWESGAYREPSLIYIEALLGSLPADIFRMLAEASTCPLHSQWSYFRS